jgi:glycosyltransferase involved in cell wall biosynthesis
VFGRVDRVFLSRSQSYLNTLVALPGSEPLQVAYYRSETFARSVERLLPEHDGVLSHLVRCAEYVRRSNKPRILEMTDVISLNYERVRKLKNPGGLKSHVYSLEAKRLIAYERRIVEDFDLSILVSEIDKEYLVGIDHEKVMVCSNGVALDQLPFKVRNHSKPVIVYIGNMLSLQNMDACLFFAKEVMPLVSESVNAIFRVVGRISDGDAARLRSFPNVEVTGAVDDMAGAVDDARIGVCPVRMAAGIQNKVLEYMALGLPVVTTPIGLEGFAAQPERDLLVAATPKAYSDAIIRLWNDDALRKRLAVNAYGYVSVNHQWERQLAPMVKRVTALLDGSPSNVR